MVLWAGTMGGRWVSTASGREHPRALELLFPQEYLSLATLELLLPQ